jgi:aminoglycoside phosphotransferase (APT) family kinase protein
MGLPVPTVWNMQQIADRWGIVFDRVNGVSFAEQMQGDVAPIPQYLEILARLHTRIHAHPANQFRSLKVWLATSITRTTVLDEPRKQILLDGLKNMPDDDRLCHGDFHPLNVLGEASQPFVIDWPDACRGERCSGNRVSARRRSKTAIVCAPDGPPLLRLPRSHPGLQRPIDLFERRALLN